MQALILYIYLSAISQGLNPHIAISIAVVESGLNPSAVGKTDDIGLFQVRHNLVKESKSQLLNPATNTDRAIELLVNAEKGCRLFPNNSWVICYNRGIAGGRKVKQPLLDHYFNKVNKVYKCVKKYKYIDLVKNELNLNKLCSVKY